MIFGADFTESKKGIRNIVEIDVKEKLKTWSKKGLVP